MLLEKAFQQYKLSSDLTPLPSLAKCQHDNSRGILLDLLRVWQNLS